MMPLVKRLKKLAANPWVLSFMSFALTGLLIRFGDLSIV